jgi:hypothetical protein
MPNEPTIQCAFRLPASLVERLDRHAELMSKSQPGMTFTRADVVRVLLVKALDRTEEKGARRR